MYSSRIWSKWLFNICQDSWQLQRRWKNANANIWEWSSVDQNFPRNVCYLLFWALLKCNATIIYQFSCLFGKWWRDNLFLPLNFPSGKSFPKSNSWQIIIREGKPPRRFEYYANGQTDRIKFMKQVEATNTERASKNHVSTFLTMNSMIMIIIGKCERALIGLLAPRFNIAAIKGSSAVRVGRNFQPNIITIQF